MCERVCVREGMCVHERVCECVSEGMCESMCERGGRVSLRGTMDVK